MRRWLTAISAAITGNVTGAMGDMVQAAAINYLQGLAASEVKRITANLGDGAEAEAARAAMHAIVGCAGAAGQGGNCSAGALGAGAGSVINALLSSDQKKLDPEEKEARRNLVESLVAGIALAAGTSVMDATFAAVNETENNYLKPDELKSYLAALQAWKDCTGGSCALAEKEVRRLQAVSQGRNYAAEGACLDDPAACAAVAKTLQADIAALEVQAKSLDPKEAATAANNLQQARKAYYSNLEWRAYAAQQELETAGKGWWLASMSGQELYESGYLTQQEASDLQAMRRETLAAAFVPPALVLGLKGGGSTAGQRIQSVVEEAKASALRGAKATANVREANFADNAKLLSHFEKHGAEFGVKSSSEYLQVGKDIIKNGDKVQYLYRGEIRTGYVQFMGNSSRGDAKYGFVGTNSDGAITTIHVESGKSFLENVEW